MFVRNMSNKTSYNILYKITFKKHKQRYQVSIFSYLMFLSPLYLSTDTSIKHK